MPSKPTAKWLCHWCLLMLSASGLAQPIDNIHGTDDTSSSQPNIFQRQKTIVQAKRRIVLEEPCTAMIRDIMATADRADLQCATPSGMLYTIPQVDKTWIEEKQLNHELISGVSQIDLPPKTLIDVETQTLVLYSEPILRNPTSRDSIRGPRKLATADKAKGTKTVLVVRVEATDTSTSLSEAELASDVFGDAGDPNNLRSQYLACSYDKFELTKAWGRRGVSTNIVNGITTVQVPLSKSAGEAAILNAINSEMTTQFSTRVSDLADFVMFCLPPGVMHPDDIAYAHMNGYRSVYNDVACQQVSTQLHEIGHNLNLNHSGRGNSEYGDKSCMMGFSYDKDDIPYMCFNAAKSWQLGWYSDKAFAVKPTPSDKHDFTVELNGIVDYGVTNKHVLIKIEQEQSTWAYFINYNLAKGMNRSTQLGKDRVLVTLKDTSDEGNTSNLIAELKLDQKLTIRNFNGRAGEELSVEWKSITNDVAIIFIGLTAPSITQSPTTTPSTSPTLEPSLLLSQAPSTAPSLSPTLEHSLLPSQTPSTARSLSPSLEPTLLPSKAPSISPSLSPSLEPTLLPSQTPSLSPSIDPSMEPSPVPSLLPSFMPSDLPSTVPSQKPSLLPTEVDSTAPTLSEEPSVSSAPSPAPSHSDEPTVSAVPSQTPSISPSSTPTKTPSTAPSLKPSQSPSLGPSQSPSRVPSLDPSQSPSMFPSLDPSLSPSHSPSLDPSPSPSQGPSLDPSQSPSNVPTLKPSQHPFQGPSPSSVPSTRPLLSETGSPTVNPTQATSEVPSSSPTFIALELQTTMKLQIPGGIHSSTILQMCDEVESHLDANMKLIYGPEVQTSVECRPDDPEPQAAIDGSNRNDRSENIFDHIGGPDIFDFGGLGGDGGDSDVDGEVGRSMTVNVVATTFFPQRSVAPFQADFDTYIFNSIATDKLNVLPQGFKMESDDSTYPPVLRLAISTGTQASMSLGCIICSSLTLLILLVN
ncbi:unnamed protein product [Cylindrotheca closterium]|uniref:Circumsporozoite protein n=1 Tax=Cylindrotheca closterium TaxID=2856 RepID=A0AAD2G441_9STRA|nr:unnamed protein product [Cylindrotheca closterium]